MRFICLANNRYIKAQEIVSVRLLPPTKEDDNYYIRLRSNYVTWQQDYTNEGEANLYFDHIMSVLRSL